MQPQRPSLDNLLLDIFLRKIRKFKFHLLVFLILLIYLAAFLMNSSSFYLSRNQFQVKEEGKSCPYLHVIDQVKWIIEFAENKVGFLRNWQSLKYHPVKDGIRVSLSSKNILRWILSIPRNETGRVPLQMHLYEKFNGSE